MESKALVIDSNIFVAFYDQNDSQHLDAVRLLKELESATFIVHPYVVQEVTTVLTYRFGFEVANKFLSDITTAENIIFPTINLQSEIQFFSLVKRKMSFTDIALINLTKQMSAGLLTFDQQILSTMKRRF